MDAERRDRVKPASRKHMAPMTSSCGTPRPDSRAAFTLVEILVTLVILSGGIVLVLRAFDTAALALGESRDALRAVSLLNSRMAAIDAEVAEYGAIRRLEGRFAPPYESYLWRVESLETFQSSKVSPVQVRVWRDRGLASDELRGVTVSTLIREPSREF